MKRKLIRETPSFFKEKSLRENMSYSDVQYGHQDLEATLSYDGKFAIFLRDLGEDENRLSQIHRLEINSINPPIPITNIEAFITEIHVSPFSNHVAFKTDNGDEKKKIFIRNYLDDESISIPGGTKQVFGGWTKSGIYFFENFSSDRWRMRFFDLKTAQIIEEKDEDVGYFPGILGHIQETPIVINQHAKFDYTIFNTQRYNHLSNNKTRRLRGGNSYNDSLFCISEYTHEKVGEIIRFNLNNNQLTEQVVISSEELGKRINVFDEHPRGEIHSFFCVNDELIINFNQDGSSELHRYSISQRIWSKIDLNKIKSQIGEFWIDDFDFNHHTGILLSVSSFCKPQHLWRLDLESEDLVQLTEPSYSVKVGQTTSEIFLANDGLDMQYHIIEPDEVNDLTETIVFFHGGPTVQTTCKWDRVIASFLSENFRVIAPNPRGGIGRGADYCSLDDGKKRLNLMDNEIGPFIEKMNSEFGNICVYGGSYGGWIVLTLATSLTWGKYLKAAASRNGIACMETFFDKTAPWRVKHREREYLGEIDETEKAQLIKKLSPIASDTLECNNLLLICGEKDPRVPIATSENFANKFNLDELEEFLRFNDEGHKIKRLTNRKELIEKTIQLFRNVSN